MQAEWAVKDSSHNYSLGMVCDLDSNVFVYGSYSEYDNGGDLLTAGSFLEKFSTQGNLTLMKKWPTPSFLIQKVIYDGSGYFYFTGYFSESCTVDGISISCKGNKDGMIGKMSASGTILWITTFGSSKDEMGYGLCFEPSKNSLILIGSTTDSLVVNNAFVDNGQQSMLIAQFSLSGALQSHKLYDFLPQRDGANAIGGNIGQEIYPATNGNYFILAFRQGSRLPTYPDTIIGTREGEYVMKLNPGFDTLWTKFIIGPSDYGSGAGPLKISAAGDPYVISAMASHYGGTNFIQRLDQNNGVVTWSETHTDGGFSDIFLEGNTLFTCGTDSATYCPCPNQNYGYQDVKTFDQNNTMTDILKFDAPQYFDNYIYFQNITRDGYGNTFVLGSFIYLKYIVFGNDTVKADNNGDTTIYGYSGAFLLKLNNNIPCIPPTIPTGANVTICANNTAHLSASGTGTLGWYSRAVGGTYLGGGANYTTPTLDASTTYYVQDSTCAASTTRKAVLVSVNPLPTVTANASATNVCAGTSVTLTGGGATSYIWSGGITNGVSFVPISTATYTVTGTDENNCFNTATKTITVNPLPTIVAIASVTSVCAGSSVTLTGTGATSYTWSGGVTNGIGFAPTTTATYTVTGTDGNNCSNTATKIITVNPLPDITTNLTGLTITANQTGAIYQWLDCSNGKSPIAGATNRSYTASINGDYSVIVSLNSCSDTSICVNINTTAIKELVKNKNQLTVFPNPSTGVLTIQSISEGEYSIRTESGQTIQSFKLNTTNNFTVNIENLSMGIYFIFGFNNNEMTNQKVVITK